MSFPRASGILLHPTSLPGPDGIGDLGPEAHRWVEWLARNGQRIWQVLPLGPTGYGDSPYQAFSAFAGNPYLVSADALVEDGLMTAADLADRPELSDTCVDYGPVITWKLELLRRAFQRFRSRDGGQLRPRFEAFRAAHAAWLDTYALFTALKRETGGLAWTDWEPGLARRQAAAIEAARGRLADAIAEECFRQFVVFRQWNALRAHGKTLGVRIVGDAPIFVAHDSADVWAHRELFHLDDAGAPTVVAGVPPDYFSVTGQRWGNPLYRWDVMARDGYAWWIERLSSALELFDQVRLDHFRGLEGYWEIPASEETAVNGRWVPGPGAAFLTAARDALGSLPLIAEDLGVITPEVLALRERFGIPGMKVLQFAFGNDADDPYLPHNHERNAVVYTGTHDNETTRGWYALDATDAEKDRARRYLNCDGHDIAWDMIRAAFASVAHTAVVPFQDVLSLGPEARMNRPGRPTGNWAWRFRWADVPGHAEERLRDVTGLYGR
jgi:4-alpha-glucanotransferase